MQSDDAAFGYRDVAIDAYETCVEMFATSNRQSIAYVRSLARIMLAPYATSQVEAVATENLERANAVAALTADCLDTTSSVAAYVARKTGRLLEGFADTYVDAMRGIADASLENVSSAKDAVVRLHRPTFPAMSNN